MNDFQKKNEQKQRNKQRRNALVVRGSHHFHWLSRSINDSVFVTSIDIFLLIRFNRSIFNNNKNIRFNIFNNL